MERVNKGEKYWFISGLFTVEARYETNSIMDAELSKANNYFPANKYSKKRIGEIARKLRAVLNGAEVIEMPSYEKEVIDSEEIYHRKEYDRGEYCHKQSFLWGFQEGVDFLQSKTVK